MRRLSLPITVFVVLMAIEVRADDTLFTKTVAPILQQRCLSCHNDNERKGELSLAQPSDLLENEFVIPGDAVNSRLLEVIVTQNGKAEMPKKADPLAKEEVAAIRNWINSGAKWPADFTIADAEVTDSDWWSLQPMQRRLVPKVKALDFPIRSPIDAFVATRMPTGVSPSPPADKPTLARRVYFDLVGLPPTPKEMKAFLSDDEPQAYERLVDRLLASERYGERWARHWLDVVHYGDTHGYDKDKLRPNAWPYRDYVIRSFNEDTPYARFVKEQLAGDVLYGDDPRLIAATGFIVAGPWDFIGHVEVTADKKDGRVARNLDRDDMVVNTIQTFCSATVGCARCHNHKFDPITQEDYYRLQAVFAAIGRKDRPYDADPETARKRAGLATQKEAAQKRKSRLEEQIANTRNQDLDRLDAEIDELAASRPTLGDIENAKRSPRYGYHSQVAKSQDTEKWVQVDLGREVPIDSILLFGADEYGFADFGFPHRFKIEIANKADFTDARVIADHTANDFARPGSSAVRFQVADDHPARFVRATATKLWSRRHHGQAKTGDWIFALGEMAVLAGEKNVAAGASVKGKDSIEALPRWGAQDLTDSVFGKYKYEDLRQHLVKKEVAKDTSQADVLLSMTPDRAAQDRLAALKTKRSQLFRRLVPKQLRRDLEKTNAELARIGQSLKALPKRQQVYAAATHFSPEGNHKPSNGKPAKIHVLNRGEVDAHLQEVAPGTLRSPGLSGGAFPLPGDHTESDRRIALTEWIVHKDNPLTWRSIVNRMWQYHFGRGIVDSPNDFGRMGREPSHPDLLDWLAIEFRDGGDWIHKPQSLKSLHRLIVTSSTYRQASKHVEEHANADGSNRFLWRYSRRRLEAEAIRDAVLSVAGKLKTDMYGAGFRDFVLEQTSHSPQFMYAKYDPDDETTHRRSVYRFLPRSQPQPFMESLDCADPSQQVAKRDETVTALSALALLNNQFMVRMSEHFATRIEQHSANPEQQMEYAMQLALSRPPTEREREILVSHANEHGLPSACRVVLNMNEFVFVD